MILYHIINEFVKSNCLLFTCVILKVSLLAARNEQESVQIALRPKVSWVGSSIAGSVQVQCNDLCSTSGDRFGSSNQKASC